MEAYFEATIVLETGSPGRFSMCDELYDLQRSYKSNWVLSHSQTIRDSTHERHSSLIMLYSYRDSHRHCVRQSPNDYNATRARFYARTNTNTNSNTSTNTYKHTHTHTHTHTHIHIHTCTNIYTHTYTHTHIHACVCT